MTGGDSLREQRKRETGERIKAAARKIMVEAGYEGLTMRALAEAAGVGLGTICLHFKDKKTLLLSTFHDEIGRETLQAMTSMSKDGTLKDKFMAFFAGLYGYYGRHAAFLRPVVQEAVFATGEWKRRFDDQLEGIVDRAVELIEGHKELGEVRPEVVSRHVAMAGWSLYLSGLVDGLNEETFDVAAQLAKVEPLIDVLLNGVLARTNDNSGQAAEQ